MFKRTARQQITEEVTTWPGVEAGPGDRGAFSFKLGRREIGHLHGDHDAHFGFAKDIWAQLIKQGRIVPHPFFPAAQGPAARSIDDENDVREVIELMRLNYDRLVARYGLPAKVKRTTPLIRSFYGRHSRRYVEIEAHGLKRRCEAAADRALPV